MEINQEALDEAIGRHMTRVVVQINWHVRDIADELDLVDRAGIGILQSGEAQAEIERQFKTAVAKTYRDATFRAR